MSQIVRCPVCQCEHTVTDEQIGMLVACTRCGSAFPAGAQAVRSGAAAPPAAPYVPQAAHTGKATASLVLGIISLCTCFMYGIPSLICGILAVVFGRKAKGMIARGEMPRSAEGSAKAGIVCGTIAIVLSALVWLAVIVAISLAIIAGPGQKPQGGFRWRFTEPGGRLGTAVGRAWAMSDNGHVCLSTGAGGLKS